MPKPAKDKKSGDKKTKSSNAPLAGMEKDLVDIPVPTVIEDKVDEPGSKGDESDDGKGGDGPVGEKGDDDEEGGGDVTDEPGFCRKKRSSISAAGKTAEPKTPEESRLDAIVSMGLFSYAVL